MTSLKVQVAELVYANSFRRSSCLSWFEKVLPGLVCLLVCGRVCLGALRVGACVCVCVCVFVLPCFA
jgi:hypothetical protein